MPDTDPRQLSQSERYLAHRRPFEIGYWLVSCCLSAMGGSYAKWADYRRLGLPLDWWQSASWSWSSAVAQLALVPALLWFTRCWPLHLDTWRRHLLWYLPASIVWSVLHVVGMVLMRKAVYVTQGYHYDFGYWPAELLYEYSKDVRTFIGMVLVIHGYRLLVLRLQGEASVLDAADEGAPDPTERPGHLLVRKLGREFLIVADQVEWLQASGNYVNLHLDGHVYPLRSTMSGIEARLDPARFVRIHRSYMVNLDAIASIEPLDSGDARVHLKHGDPLPCSRSYRQALRERFAPTASGWRARVPAR